MVLNLGLLVLVVGMVGLLCSEKIGVLVVMCFSIV